MKSCTTLNQNGLYTGNEPKMWTKKVKGASSCQYQWNMLKEEKNVVVNLFFHFDGFQTGSGVEGKLDFVSAWKLM